MKKVFILICLFASIAYSQRAGAKIFAEQSLYDFGKIKAGEKVSRDFVVQNKGGDTLIIKNVRASCGCTAVKPEKSNLLPGESTKINVIFNSSGRKGHQKKYVYVFSNDVANPELRLSFTADILEQTESSKVKAVK
ncbi:MAG: hypothetical protein A2V66_16955 [Ignavibacteria bacterium RBG_13_36_8]|nr:MAG: hypothetical protein A2V66_16955 [Ignavibacteria bacterium RBG_13_36_8]